MYIPKHLCQKTVAAAVLLALSFTTVSTAETGYGSAKEDGFFYYKDPKKESKPKPEKKPVKEQRKVAPQPPQHEVKKESKPDVQPLPTEAPKLGSVAWIRANLDNLRDRAIEDPTFENVQAYKYAERIVMDRASNFAEMSKKVIDQDPMLNQAVRFPIASAARSSALFQVERARRAIMEDLTQKVGLWMFFDSNCTFCHAQYATMKLLKEKYPNLIIEYISTDGKILKGMQNSFRLDVGGSQARKLGVQLTPALVMVIPQQRKFAIVAHGAMAMDEVEYKMVTAAIDLGIADNKLTKIAELEKRGIITDKDMKRIEAEAEGLDLSNPKNIIKIINGAVKRNM